MQMVLMVQKKTFQISFGFVLLYVVLTYLFYCIKYSGSALSNIVSASSLYAGNSLTVFANFLNLLFPFLTAFPFAFSYLTDKSVKILSIVQTKSGTRRYYISKTIACFVGGFTLYFIPFLISILLNLTTFPTKGVTLWGPLFSWNYSNWLTGKAVMVDAAGVGLPFLKLYIYNPLLYNLLYALIFSIFTGVLSVFAFAISFLIRRYKIYLLLPIYAIVYGFNALTFLLDTDGATKFYLLRVFDYITVDTMYGKTPFFFIGLTFALVLLSAFLIMRQIKTDQLY